MKKFIKYLFIIFISLFIFIGISNAGQKVDLNQFNSEFQNSSITGIDHSGNLGKDIETTGMKILTTIKVVFQGVLLIYIVYIGIQMILSMGSNEDDLSKSKRSIRYTLIGLVFINVPGTIYSGLKKDNYGNMDGGIGNTWVSDPTSSNLLLNFPNFSKFLDSNITGFIEVVIGAFAIIIIVISGIKILSSRGREEEVNKSKTKLVWSVLGLIFVGFIESWKSVVFSGNISNGSDLFGSMVSLALYFVGPVVIFFLTLAAYYYITSNGDEERAKKAKSMVINTMVAVVLLLASYTFLKDLLNLTF